MVQNSSNKQKERNPVLLEVLNILGMKKDAFDGVSGDFRDHIHTIMKNDPKTKSNKKLAMYLVTELGAKYFYEFPKFQNDSDFISAALKQDSQIFIRLSPKEQLNPKFAKLAIESLVREKVSFVEIEKFLTKYFPDSKTFSQMFSFYKAYLKIAEYVFYSDVERQLIDLREKNKAFYNSLFEKKILEQQGKKITVSEKFTEFFVSQITSHPGYESLSEEEKKVYKISIFARYLGLDPKSLDENISVFFASLSDIIHIKQDTKKTDEFDSDSQSDDLDTDKEDENDDFGVEDRLDFCIPHCNYSLGTQGDCDIHLLGMKLQFTADELARINDTALKNYVAAVSLLDDLGLRFALRHKETFFSICEVKPFEGEGLSDGKILKILNKVAKKIGIPEKEIVTGRNEEGEEETEKKVGCFERIDEAKLRFRNIKSSGKINDILIHDPADTGSKSIVQRKLERDGFFDDQGGGFSNQKAWRS